MLLTGCTFQFYAKFVTLENSTLDNTVVLSVLYFHNWYDPWCVCLFKPINYNSVIFVSLFFFPLKTLWDYSFIPKRKWSDFRDVAHSPERMGNALYLYSCAPKTTPLYLAHIFLLLLRHHNICLSLLVLLQHLWGSQRCFCFKKKGESHNLLGCFNIRRLF